MAAVTEAMTTSDHLMTKFSIPGYESFYKNRIHKRGVLYYVKNNYPAVKITEQDSEEHDSVYVEVETSKHHKVTFGVVYRPPKQQATDDAALYEENETIIQNKQSIVIGDLNCPNID